MSQQLDENGFPISVPPKGTRGVYVDVTSDLGPLVTVWRLPMKFEAEHDDPLRWEKERMPALFAALEMTNPKNGQPDGYSRMKIEFKEWADLWGSSGSAFAAEASALEAFTWIHEPWWREGVDEDDE